MCLAVPGRISKFTRTNPAMAEVDFGGVVQPVCTEYVPEAAVGDYVIVHVGFAIARLDEHAAKRTLDTLAEVGRSHPSSTAAPENAAATGNTPEPESSALPFEEAE